MAVTWNPADKDTEWGLSAADMTGTRTGSGDWRVMRATHGFDAAHPTGVYFEITLDNAWANIMMGVSRNTDGLNIYTAAGMCTAYNVGGVYGANFTSSGSFATYGTSGDRIGFFVRDGHIWLRKNGTWSGDPNANTGPFASGLSGTVYPVAIGYAPSGGIITLCANRTDITGSLPTSGAPLDSAFDLDTTFVDSAGSPLASLAVEWAVFQNTAPDGIGAPERTGSGTTDGSGVLNINYAVTGVAVGGTCGLLVSTTAGTADVNCRSYFMPRSPTVT